MLLANYCFKVYLSSLVTGGQLLKQSILKVLVLLVRKLHWAKNISGQKFTTIFLLKQDAITFVNLLPNFEQ